MNLTTVVAAAAAAAVFAPSATGQLMKGSKAPAFEFARVWNDGPASFGELEGKLVLLDFSQTW